MLAEERFALILEQLNEKRTVTVQQLCEALHTSESTIRRDLTELDRQGRLTKVHKTAVETFDNGTATVNTETCKELGLDFDTVKKAFEPLCTQVNEITTAESFDEVETK